MKRVQIVLCDGVFTALVAGAQVALLALGIVACVRIVGIVL